MMIRCVEFVLVPTSIRVSKLNFRQFHVPFYPKQMLWVVLLMQKTGRGAFQASGHVSSSWSKKVGGSSNSGTDSFLYS
jgi:hypothetical protein